MRRDGIFYADSRHTVNSLPKALAQALTMLVALAACTSDLERAAARASADTASLAGGLMASVVDTALAERVDAVLEPLVAANAFSGAVVLSRDGRVRYARGIGMANHEKAVPFTIDTPSDGASLAKTFTASGIWWLALEKRVDLDAPVRRYVAEYPHASITVRQLLSHSNGLPDDYATFDAEFAKDELHTTEAMLAAVTRRALPPSFPPGSRFEYSNLGYDVGALLIERVSGQRFDSFLQERFFLPLRMRNSFVRPARFVDWPGVRTMGYQWRDTRWQLFDVFDLEAFRGGSNVYFAASDLSQWANANAAGTALPAAAMAAGSGRTVIGGQQSALTGLNWYCNASATQCYYTGDLNAFFSLVYWDRERNTSVVFVSNSSLPVWRRAYVARDLIAALTEATPEGRPDAAATPDLIRPKPGSFARLAGTYAIENGDSVTVRLGPRGLRFRLGAALDYDVFAVSPSAFYVPGLDLVFGFTGSPQPTTIYLQSIFLVAVARRTTR